MYKELADQDDAEALCNLGYIYGNDLEADAIDHDLAFYILRESRKNLGDAVALCNIGDCYEKGNGVTQIMKKLWNITNVS